MNTASTPSKDLPDTYAGLLARHMLRPIHDPIDFDNASAMIDALRSFPARDVLA